MKLKQKFSRISALLLAMLMLLGTVACAGTEDTADTTADTTAEPGETTAEPSDDPVGDEKNVILYVSPDGDDETGKPYRTLEGVKNAVRAIDKTNLESITVYFKEGRYDSYTTNFTEEDSGTENCRITYAAYNDAEVIIGAAKVIPNSAFRPVEDEAIKASLKEDVRDKVLCASLTDAGMTLDECKALRTERQDSYGHVSLYANGMRQTNARYPDYEYLHPEIVAETEDTTLLRYLKNSDVWNNDIGTWNFSDRDIFTWGCWQWEWSDSIFRVTDMEPKRRTLTLSGKHHYGVRTAGHYCFYNVLEEITVPGEWSYDLENGMIYYYPTEDFENSVITVSTHRDDLLKMSNAGYLTFSGIILEGGQEMGVGGTMHDVTFDHCIIRDINSYGMRFIGNNVHITDCEFTQLGISCLDIDGGDRETLTPSGNLIENCYFHHYSQVRGLGYGDFAAWIRGMACTFRHNECAYAPFGAVQFYGNEHLIEYNEFHHLGSEMDDGGIIYSGRHYDYCRNVIRYNYFHDITSEMTAEYTGTFSPLYFYEDDSLCNTTVYGNLFVGKGGEQHNRNRMGGMDSICDNNIFLNTRCGPDYWGTALFKADENEERDRYLLESPYMTDIWKEAYPELDKYRNGAMEDYPEDLNVSICHNLWFTDNDTDEVVNRDRSADMDIKVENNRKIGMDSLSLYFVDPENGDYTMKEDAPIFTEDPGFEAIPFAQMGRNKG